MSHSGAIVRKRLVWIGLAAVGAAVVGGIQFLRPVVTTNPPPDSARVMSAHIAVSPPVDSILRRACYDCHSLETRWPVYSRIAPVSWLVQADILSGRSDLNFSDWSIEPEREPTPRQRLGGICNDVRRGIMPPRSYRMMHPSARLSAEDVARVCAWTDSARAVLSARDALGPS